MKIQLLVSGMTTWKGTRLTALPLNLADNYKDKSGILLHRLHPNVAVFDAATEGLDSIPDPVDHSVDLRTSLLPEIKVDTVKSCPEQIHLKGA